MRVLLVEDDRATAQSIELMLKSEGFNVYATDQGEEGVELAKIYDYDLILLAVNRPETSGLDVLRQLRVGKVSTPIMMLGSRDTDIETKVKTFGGGADDFLTKPFHKEEMICRVHAIVRRSKGHAQAVIEVGPISVNLDAKQVRVNGRSIRLTGKEYMMIELLALRANATITKEMFLNHLYGGMDEPELKIVDVFLCKLRKKIREASPGAEAHIETVWGRGYSMLTVPTVQVRKRLTRANAESILLHLAAKSASRSAAQITEAVEGRVASIRTVLPKLANDGLIEKVGHDTLPRYRITDAGRAAVAQ